MSKPPKLPKYEQTLSAVLLSAKEAVILPMRPKMREHDVTEPQCRVMRVINDHGPTDASRVAEIGQLHKPSVTRILKELEARNLVARETDNRRRVLVALTPDGHELVKTLTYDVRRVMAEYSERFGAERLERLINELRALTATISGVE